MAQFKCTAGEFAEACEHAAVQLRVAGKPLGDIDVDEWLAMFVSKLGAQIQTRVAASFCNAATRTRLRLVESSPEPRQLGAEKHDA